MSFRPVEEQLANDRGHIDGRRAEEHAAAAELDEVHMAVIVGAQQQAQVVADFAGAARERGKVLVRVVASLINTLNELVPVVVDPVAISKHGDTLLAGDARDALLGELLPRTTVLTPNLDEAAILAGGKVRTVEEMRAAAREIRRRFGCVALVKGGHLKEGREAVDVFFDGKDELLLTAPRVKGIRTHGTGCAYSAAITAHLALGLDLPASVVRAKEFISRAIAGSRRVGRHWVLNFNRV